MVTVGFVVLSDSIISGSTKILINFDMSDIVVDATPIQISGLAYPLMISGNWLITQFGSYHVDSIRHILQDDEYTINPLIKKFLLSGGLKLVHSMTAIKALN